MEVLPAFPKSLHDLPTEILVYICEQCCVHCREKASIRKRRYDDYFHGNPFSQQIDRSSWYSLDRAALGALSRTTKLLRDIAQPILYHEFLLGYADSWQTERYSWNGRLSSFLTTISCREDLAALVERVSIHPSLTKFMTGDEASSTFDRITFAQGFQVPVDLLRVNRRQPEKGPDFGRIQNLKVNLLGMLITLLPNLNHLGIQWKGVYPFSIPTSFLHGLSPARLPLQNLDLALFADDLLLDDGLDLGHVARAILPLTPGLQHLRMHMCDSIRPSVALPSLQSLRTLHITHSMLDKKTLQHILQACPNLSHFHFEAAKPRNRNQHSVALSSQFHAADAEGLISEHTKQLKFLFLDLRVLMKLLSPIRTVKTLTALRSLESLALDTFSIYGNPRKSTIAELPSLRGVLPSSICSLSLFGRLPASGGQDPSHQMAENLISLAKAVAAGKFPNLKYISHDALGNFGAWGVEQRFAASGVRFEFREHQPTEPTLIQGQPHPGYDAIGQIPTGWDSEAWI